MGLPIRRAPFTPMQEFTGHSFTATYSLAITPDSDLDAAHDFTATYSLAFTPSLPTSVDTGIPYSVMPVVRIDGTDVTTLLIGQVNVTLQDNAAATFQVTIHDATNKPASYLNKQITIGFQAADSTGETVLFQPLLVGMIKSPPFNEATKTFITLRGYDCSGVHNTRGELISQGVTTTKEGSIQITGAGTYNTGQAPIWGVKLVDSTREDLVDGTDWFASTLDGMITIPITSNFIANNGGLKYSYAEPFDTLKDIIDYIAGIKNWIIEEDGITINDSDYTTPAKQPVISLSNESVIDTVTKLLELAGAKLRGNLYPNMSVYNELTNLTGANNHILTESDYYDGSLDIVPDIDNLLTEQTVRSVAKTYATADISGVVLLLEESDTSPFDLIFNFDANLSSISTEFFVTKSVVAEIKIPRSNIFSISHTASGQFTPMGADAPFNIVDSDWTQTIKDNQIIYKLETWPLLIVVWQGTLGFRIWLYTPAANWTLTVNGQKIEYGETVEQTVSVTATRPVTGITTALVGDVEEHPWMETGSPGHGANLGNAILLTAGNFYSASCERPLHMVPTMKIGDKVNIKRGSDTIFKGLCKRLAYSLDLETAAAPVAIDMEGLGFGI